MARRGCGAAGGNAGFPALGAKYDPVIALALVQVGANPKLMCHQREINVNCIKHRLREASKIRDGSGKPRGGQGEVVEGGEVEVTRFHPSMPLTAHCCALLPIRLGDQPRGGASTSMRVSYPFRHSAH